MSYTYIFERLNVSRVKRETSFYRSGNGQKFRIGLSIFGILNKKRKINGNYENLSLLFLPEIFTIFQSRLHQYFVLQNYYQFASKKSAPKAAIREI